MRAFALLCSMAIIAGIGLLVAGFEFPPMESVQRGYRGTGMQQVENPRLLNADLANNQIPEPEPPAEPGGEPATSVYENVQVLNDLTYDEFNRVMVAITAWVSPEQGCGYCHNLENMAEDSVYTKHVSRRMLQMTRHINADWKTHVQGTGVTCHTCHRGQPVPANIWFADPGRPHSAGLAGNPAGQNGPGTAVGMASLPNDPYTPFLQDDQPIRVNSTTALPEGNLSSTKQTEWTYGLMMHMSTSLGVNCTYCHNSRQFSAWDQSAPTRTSAWYGIRMTRELNVNYMDPLLPVYPTHRLGITGDAPKANCTTCHQGAYKPYYGASMLKDYPELAGPTPGPAPAIPSAAAAAAAKTSAAGAQAAIVTPAAAVR